MKNTRGGRIFDFGFPVFGDFSDWDGGTNRSVSKNQYQTTKYQGTLLDLKKKMSRITFWKFGGRNLGSKNKWGFGSLKNNGFWEGRDPWGRWIGRRPLRFFNFHPLIFAC